MIAGIDKIKLRKILRLYIETVRRIDYVCFHPEVNLHSGELLFGCGYFLANARNAAEVESVKIARPVIGNRNLAQTFFGCCTHIVRYFALAVSVRTDLRVDAVRVIISD